MQNGASFGAGKVAQAFAVSGAGQHVQVPDDPAWAFGSGAFSINLWVNFSQTGGRQPMIAHDDGGGNQNKWLFWLDNSQLVFHLNSPALGPADVAVAPWSPTPGTWYHVAVTRNGSAYTLYVNGVAVAAGTSTASIPDAQAPLTIAGAEAFFLAGSLDEVGIFNRALSGAEVQAIYAADSAGMCR